MESFSFDELVSDRRAFIRSIQKNKFDFENILTGLYHDPSHFVYEIIQNAEDAGAKKVRFILFEDRLEIFHDGKAFDNQDIEAVTGIGISTKKDDINSIGKFGVGFKSVFAITQTPKIQSGKFHIQIEDFVIPEKINDCDHNANTVITLPFNHQSRTKEEVFNLVEKKLENLGLRSLLFLKNIKEIEWESPNIGGHYFKTEHNLSDLFLSKKVEIVAVTNKREMLQEYLVLGKKFCIANNELNVEVAFQIDNNEVIPIKDPRLVVYFPTERVTYLKFLIQGPYKTTPNRENIPYEDAENKIITKKIAELVAESISEIKRLGFLNINFLNVLPLDEQFIGTDPIYASVFNSVKTKLSSNENLLPTFDGNFIRADSALLARSRKLTSLFSPTDIILLFSKESWLDTNITNKKETENLLDYLINVINIREIDFETIARALNESFIALKEDKWLSEFYTNLLEQPSLWREGWGHNRRDLLRAKPIIRLEDGSHIAPFNEDNEVQAYLPTDTQSQYPTVKRAIIEHDDLALKFLESLGLSEPDLFAEIHEFIIPKYENKVPNVNDAQYLSDLSKLFQAISDKTNPKRDDLVSKVKESQIIKSKNSDGEILFKPPNQVYAIDNNDLQNYFANNKNVFFLDESLSEFKKQYNDFDELLCELGIAKVPRRVKEYIWLTEKEKNRLRETKDQPHGKDQFTYDYKLEGLEIFFSQPITLNQSLALWNLLIDSLVPLSSQEAKSYFYGTYCWKYYNNYFQQFESSFLKILCSKEWLFNVEGELLKPSEITWTKLASTYDTKSTRVDILKEVLKFRPEFFDRLPEKDKKKLELIGDRSHEELKEALALLDAKVQANQVANKESDDKWIPKMDPNGAKIEIFNLVPQKKRFFKTSVPIDNELKNEQLSDPGNNSDEDRDKENQKNEKKAIDIGKWGEKYVYAALKKDNRFSKFIRETEYGFVCSDGNFEIEVHWLNIHTESGKGCDFILIKDGKEIEYIEVKTTESDSEELFQVSGYQWKLAQQLFEKEKGDKYKIYRVINAGKSTAQIWKLSNPYKHWKDGNLYAHPVNLKL